MASSSSSQSTHITDTRDIEKHADDNADSEANDICEPLGGQLHLHSSYAHDPRYLERTSTADSIYSLTVGGPVQKPASSTNKLPPFGAGKEYPPSLPSKEDYLVDFEGPDDPLHPQNWPMRRKIVTSANLGFMTLVSAWGSSVFSAGLFQVAETFGVSEEVSTLGLTLYVVGFATGPLAWAPFSELKGRKLPLVIAGFGSGIFQIGVAVAKDIQTVLICRFFAGAFAAAPLAVVGAAFADMFDSRQRGTALALFAGSVFAGPMIAPIAGGFMVLNPSVGWRWTEYVTAIAALISSVLVLFFYTETYAPVILVDKASQLRRVTGNWGIHAKQEEIEVDFKDLIMKNFLRPLRMLVDEPIILLITLYTAFIYGILYLLLGAYPIIFQQIRGWNSGVGALPFLGIVVGEIIGAGIVIAFEPWYNRRTIANGGRPVPEARLPPLIIGSVVFPAGMFWLAWSGPALNVHWIVPVLAGIPIGTGLLVIFLSAISYLVDAFLAVAASALAANTFLRSMFGGVFPLFTRQMFDTLTVQYAGTLLGCLGVLMIPIPILFYIFGERIRKMSKRAPT